MEVWPLGWGGSRQGVFEVVAFGHLNDEKTQTGRGVRGAF